jgi:hypothetical protein
MRNEIIYASSAKVLILEKSPPFFKANIYGKIIEIKEIGKLGIIFPLITNQILKDRNSAKNKLEEIFQNIPKSNPLAGSLEYYLRKGNVVFTLAGREEGKPQYLGLDYENPINLESDIKKSIIPCQFYLIKDNLQEKLIKYPSFFPTSESSSNYPPASDWTSQLPTSKIYHPQEFSLVLL